MKQRLGIAAALLKDPAVLILDEPANGLDPAGIVEVRELVRRLGAEGRTVFVSSHILSEIQHTADRVAILAHGRLVKAGPVHEVLASRAGEGVLVRLRDPEAGRTALSASGVEATVVGDRFGSDRARRGREGHAIPRRAGLVLSELRPDEVDLETVFLELTSEAEPPT